MGTYGCVIPMEISLYLVLHKLQMHFAQLRLILPYAALLKPQRQKVKPINQFLNCFIFCIFHRFISSNSCVNFVLLQM